MAEEDPINFKEVEIIRSTGLKLLTCFLAVAMMLSGFPGRQVLAEAPLSVAEAIAGQDGSVKQVIGYIVGTTGSVSAWGTLNYDGPWTVNTNILLADSPGERDESKLLAVQLPSGAVRDAVNLAANPGNHMRQVILTGQLSAYFTKPGLRSVSAYEFVGEEDPPIPDLLSIAEAKALADGTSVIVRAVATTQPGIYGGLGFYIQDASAGIYAYSGSSFGVNAGDTLIVSGTMGVYNGERQLNISAVTVDAEQLPVPEPALKTASEVSLDNEGTLIKLEAVKINSITLINSYGTFEMVVEDATGTVLIRVDNRIGLTYAQFPGAVGDYYDIVGVIGQYRGILQVKPRDPAELVPADAPTEPGADSIAAAKLKTDGEQVTVTGVITAPTGPFGSSTFYIQDESAGIMIYKPSSVPFVTRYGDKVRITGTIAAYRGERQIAAAAIELVEEGVPLPAPVPVPAAAVADYEGSLVLLERAKITALGNPDSYGNISIILGDDSGSLEMRIDSRTGIDYSTLTIGDNLQVTGISGKYYTTVQLKPRQQADLVVLPPDDAQEPIIYRLTPPSQSSTYQLRPVIGANIVEDYGLDWSSLSFAVNGTDVTSQAVRVGNRVEYTPPADLALGVQEVTINAANLVGTGTRTWQFSVIEPQEYIFVHGVPHSHTSYSDGAGTPAEAYSYAEGQGLDYLIISDHSNWLEGDQYDSLRNMYYETEGSEWQLTRAQAENYNASAQTLTALRAFEMTFRDVGHINVFNSSNYVERDTMPSLADFYQWLLDTGAEEDIIALFNHPNWPSDSFNNLAYVPELDGIIQLIEVANGAPPYSYTRAEAHYVKALDQGWHLGAANSQDNHALNWGEPDNLTGMVVMENSPAGIYEAMKARRTYATETRNLEMTFKANDFWMGSVVAAEQLDFEIMLHDPDVPIAKVEMITNGGAVLATYPAGEQNDVQWNFSHTPGLGRSWYYVRVTHVNGAMAWSSPIFTPPSEVDIKMIDLEADPNPNIPGAPTVVTATAANMGIFRAENITIDFYIGAVAPENKVASGVIETLYAGKQAKVSAEIEFTTPGDTRVFAVLRAEQDGITIESTLDRTVKIVPSIGKKMLLDAGHLNDYVPGTMLEFIKQMRFHGYNVLLNTVPFSQDLLADVDVVVLTQPDNAKNLTPAETEALAAWVEQGGSLLVAGKSNFGNDSTMLNPLLERLGAGVRINNDNVYETNPDNYTGGMIWSILTRTFPTLSDGITENMEFIRIFSSASLVNADLGALVSAPDIGLEIVAAANPSSYNFNVQPGYYTYNPEGGDQGDDIPIIARQPVGLGRLVVMGRAMFSDFELTSNFANDRLTLELVDWLARYTRAMSIADARSNCQVGDVVTVKGIVTAPTDHFFDAMYIQDETGGICVYGSQQGQLPLGTEVMVTGTLQMFEGELELAYDDWGVQVMKSGPSDQVIKPVRLNTRRVSDPEYQGMLISTRGKVIAIDTALGAITLDEGSGPALMYIDGYLGIDISMISVGQIYSFIGIGSHGSMGPRLRIRFQADIEHIASPNSKFSR